MVPYPYDGEDQTYWCCKRIDDDEMVWLACFDPGRFELVILFNQHWSEYFVKYAGCHLLNNNRIILRTPSIRVYSNDCLSEVVLFENTQIFSFNQK